jgi:hypothetical protein
VFDEMKMKSMDQRGGNSILQEPVRLNRVASRRDQSQPLADPFDVSVHRHHRTAQGEQQHAGDRLLPHSDEPAEIFPDALGGPALHKGQVAIGMISIDLPQNFLDPAGLDIGQPPGSDGCGHLVPGGLVHLKSGGKTLPQLPKGQQGVRIGGILRENGLDQPREEILARVPFPASIGALKYGRDRPDPRRLSGGHAPSRLN